MAETPLWHTPLSGWFRLYASSFHPWLQRLQPLFDAYIGWLAGVLSDGGIDTCPYCPGDWGERYVWDGFEADTEMPGRFLYHLVIGDVGTGKQNHAADSIGIKRPQRAILRGEETDVITAALDRVNDAKRRAARAGPCLQLQHIVESITDDWLRFAPQVGHDGHDTRIIPGFQWLELQRNAIFLDVERTMRATYRKQTLCTLVNLVDWRVKERADALLVLWLQYLGHRNEALWMAVQPLLLTLKRKKM